MTKPMGVLIKTEFADFYHNPPFDDGPLIWVS